MTDRHVDLSLRLIIAAQLGASLSGCIAYDEGIVLLKDDDENEHAVRVIERLPLSAAAHDACAEVSNLEGCPLPQGFWPHLFDPEKNPDYNFCSCPDGKRDERAVPTFRLYFEDQDSLDESRTESTESGVGDRVLVAEDQLFAAFLLDVDQSRDRGRVSAVYTDQLTPSTPLRLAIDSGTAKYATDSPGRPINFVRSAVISSLDLCNPGSDGLSPGWHTLTIIVTDREWLTVDGQVSFGVPNIAVGATFDTAHYVFHCTDGNATPEECQCEDE